MATAGKLRCYESESVLEDIDSAFILKEEQSNAIKAFVDGKYVFVVLPTGFGKSLIYLYLLGFFSNILFISIGVDFRVLCVNDVAYLLSRSTAKR